jgi:hypothetical protein
LQDAYAFCIAVFDAISCVGSLFDAQPPDAQPPDALPFAQDWA